MHSLHGRSLRHYVRDTLYVRESFDCWMPFGRAQPCGQHEQVDVGGAEAIAMHPFIAADLPIDCRPGLSQSTIASLLCAAFSSERFGKSVGIAGELKRVLHRVGKTDERLEIERSCRFVYRGCESGFGMSVTQEDRYRGAFMHGARFPQQHWIPAIWVDFICSGGRRSPDMIDVSSGSYGAPISSRMTWTPMEALLSAQKSLYIAIAPSES